MAVVTMVVVEVAVGATLLPLLLAHTHTRTAARRLSVKVHVLVTRHFGDLRRRQNVPLQSLNHYPITMAASATDSRTHKYPRMDTQTGLYTSYPALPSYPSLTSWQSNELKPTSALYPCPHRPQYRQFLISQNCMQELQFFHRPLYRQFLHAAASAGGFRRTCSNRRRAPIPCRHLLAP